MLLISIYDITSCINVVYVYVRVCVCVCFSESQLLNSDQHTTGYNLALAPCW